MVLEIRRGGMVSLCALSVVYCLTIIVLHPRRTVNSAFAIDVFVDADQTSSIKTQFMRQTSPVVLHQTFPAGEFHEIVIVELVRLTSFLIELLRPEDGNVKYGNVCLANVGESGLTRFIGICKVP